MHTIIHTSRCKLSQILHIYYENLNLNLLLELLFSNFTPVQMFIVRTVLMIKDKVITCCLLLITMVKLSIQRFLKLRLARWLPIAVFQVKKL